MAEWLGETSHGLFRRFPQVSTLVNSPKSFTAEFWHPQLFRGGPRNGTRRESNCGFWFNKETGFLRLPFNLLLFCTFLSLNYFVFVHPKYPLFRWSCNSTGAPPTQMEMATLIVFLPLTTFRSHWKKQKKTWMKITNYIAVPLLVVVLNRENSR